MLSRVWVRLGVSIVVIGCGVTGNHRAEVAIDLTASDALEAFSCTEPSAWRIASDDTGASALELVRDSLYEPPFRSPHSIALLRGASYRDFQIDVDLKQTGPEYAHRDLCIFFGFQSNERFYYAHLASTPDANAHNVFLVDHAARRNLLPPQSHGVEWGKDAWHHVRVVRAVATGSIRVFFDDLEHPVFDLTDQTLGEGRIGFGSFDDTGMFKSIVIRGEMHERAEMSGGSDAREDFGVKAASQTDVATIVEVVPVTTDIPLPSGGTMKLTGEWETTKALWGDHALVFAHISNKGTLKVLDVGGSELRGVVDSPWFNRVACGGGAPVFTPDGKTCLAWLDGKRQLCAIDAATGTWRSLTSLPDHAIMWDAFHCDPGPLSVDAGPAAIYAPDIDRVVFLLSKESTKEGGKIGSGPSQGQIACVDLETSQMHVLSEQGTIPSPRSFAWSKRRGHFFVVGSDLAPYLREYDLKGRVVREYSPPGAMDRIEIDRAEQRLLVEFYEISPVAVLLGGAATIDSAATRRLAVIDLDSGEEIGERVRGSNASWSPDGSSVVYRDGWNLALWSRVDESTQVIARFEPQDHAEFARGPIYYSAPVWSPAGSTFAVNIGESDGTEIIDLEKKRVMVLPDALEAACFAPVAKPFAH